MIRLKYKDVKNTHCITIILLIIDQMVLIIQEDYIHPLVRLLRFGNGYYPSLSGVWSISDPRSISHFYLVVLSFPHLRSIYKRISDRELMHRHLPETAAT
jgi:hypothetical protein